MSILWIVLVVSFIAFALAAAVRAQVDAAASSFDSERALFMAKGAAQAVFSKLQVEPPNEFPKSPMRTEGDVYVVPFDSGEVRVKVEWDGSRIDLNGADDKMMGSLLDALGVEGAIRSELVDSIMDWRDPDDNRRPFGAESADYPQSTSKDRKRIPYNAPFTSLQELLLVKHMTSGIYFAHASFDAATNLHQKIHGLSDLATVGSGRNAVDVNSASVDVLAALPGMNRNRDAAERIVAERKLKRFADKKDLSSRVGEVNTTTLEYLTTDQGFPNVLVSTATVRPSGTSKTVRLRIKAEQQRKYYQLAPDLLYRLVTVMKFGGWEY